MVKTYTNIPVSKDTGYEFEKLQLDLKVKGVLKTKDELVKMLINFYKESRNPIRQ